MTKAILSLLLLVPVEGPFHGPSSSSTGSIQATLLVAQGSVEEFTVAIRLRNMSDKTLELGLPTGRFDRPAGYLLVSDGSFLTATAGGGLNLIQTSEDTGTKIDPQESALLLLRFPSESAESDSEPVAVTVELLMSAPGSDVAEHISVGFADLDCSKATPEAQRDQANGR